MTHAGLIGLAGQIGHAGLIGISALSGLRGDRFSVIRHAGLTVARRYVIPGRPAQGRGGQDQEDRPPAGLNPAIACYRTASQHQGVSSPKQLSSREENRLARNFFHDTP
jgi:hypothetical protein